MADLTTTSSNTASPEQAKLVEDILYGFHQARLRRYNFETQWQEAALLCWPEYANTFFYGYDQMPGMKKTQQQIDATASIASHRFAAIVDSLLTPMGLIWSRLKADNKDLMKNRVAKDYFDKLTACVWAHRYRPSANFVGQNQQNFQSLGVFGNMNMQICDLEGGFYGPQKGVRYTSVPVGQMYYVENQQGQVDSYYRAFRWTARQIYQQWPDTFPEALRPALEQRSGTLYWVIEFVCPRDDYQPFRVDAKGKRFASYYVSVEGHSILQESGYRSFPMAIGRYMQAPDESYGRGPAQMVLPTLKTLNAEKTVFLKQGHRAGDPIYLTPDDGLIDPKFHPGAVNKGGMSTDGKPLIGTLPVGKIDITLEMMQEEKRLIEDAFLVTLFSLALKMEEAPEQSARQVVEMIEQKAMLLAPVIGRQQSEYLGSMIPRELDVLAYQHLLPPMPGIVREAQGQYEIEWSNPISRMMKASEIAGFMQMVEMCEKIANSSQDSTIWDNFDFDTAFPEIADNRCVPVRWIADQEKLDKARKARAQQAEREARAKELPAQAAMKKADAIVAKAQTGGNTGGTLSGTPEGGMPQIPGNPPGQPGQPGVGGQPGLPGRPPQEV
jgi:hypothetical protein